MADLVVATDSTSVNIFKALTAALSLRRERPVILSEATNFPTDVYMMQGIEAFSGGRVKAVTVAPDAVLDTLNDDVAVLLARPDGLFGVAFEEER